MNTTACNYTPCDGYDPPCLENCQRQFPKIGCCGCEMMLRETAFACGGSYIPKVRRTWEPYSGAALRDMLGTLPCMHVGGAGGTPLSVRLLSAILVQPFSRHPPAERPIGTGRVGAMAVGRSTVGQSTHRPTNRRQLDCRRHCRQISRRPFSHRPITYRPAHPCEHSANDDVYRRYPRTWEHRRTRRRRNHRHREHKEHRGTSRAQKPGIPRWRRQKTGRPRP